MYGVQYLQVPVLAPASAGRAAEVVKLTTAKDATAKFRSISLSLRSAGPNDRCGRKDVITVLSELARTGALSCRSFTWLFCNLPDRF